MKNHSAGTWRQSNDTQLAPGDHQTSPNWRLKTIKRHAADVWRHSPVTQHPPKEARAILNSFVQFCNQQSGVIQMLQDLQCDHFCDVLPASNYCRRSLRNVVGHIQDKSTYKGVAKVIGFQHLGKCQLPSLPFPPFVFPNKLPKKTVDSGPSSSQI